MKVLHIIDNLGLGGAQSAVKVLVEKQAENDELFLFSLRKADHSISVSHKNAFCFESSSKYSLFPLLELAQLIRKNHIALLHCHLPRSQVFGYLLKVFFFPDIKLVFHEQGDIFENRLFAFLLRIMLRKVEVFIACSRAAKQQLMKKSGVSGDKVTVVYNGVNMDQFSYEKMKRHVLSRRVKLGILESEYVIGFAGRFIERKGWKEFLDAAVQLKERRKVKFLIAGAGPDENRMRKYIQKLDMQDHVSLLGCVSDMPWFYSLLDVFVIPSHWEPMGIAEVEAQAMGIPVIASDVSGLNEIIQDDENGLLFEVRNSKELASKIMLLMCDLELQMRLKESGLASVRKYSADSFVENINNVYASTFQPQSLKLIAGSE